MLLQALGMDTPVIHRESELFTISVDNWDRMMTSVLAHRQPDWAKGSRVADE